MWLGVFYAWLGWTFAAVLWLRARKLRYDAADNARMLREVLTVLAGTVPDRTVVDVTVTYQHEEQP